MTVIANEGRVAAVVLARRHCPPTCFGYHATWPLVRSAGIKASPRWHTAFYRTQVTTAGLIDHPPPVRGIPTMDNVHEVAQRVAPESRIVYVDYDPVVLAHAHQLLRSSPQGATAFIQGDFRDPEHILATAAQTLDFTEPVAVMLLSILHFFPDEVNPQGIVAQLMAQTCPGSYLVASQMTADAEPGRMRALAEAPGDEAQYVFVMRTHDELSTSSTALRWCALWP